MLLPACVCPRDYHVCRSAALQPLLPKLLLSPSVAARQPNLRLLPAAVVVVLLLLLLPKRNLLATTPMTLSIWLIFEQPRVVCTAAASSARQPCIQLCFRQFTSLRYLFFVCAIHSGIRKF
jgi:hypothetical protein